MEADGVFCHLQRTKAQKQTDAPRFAQVRDAKAYEGKDPLAGRDGAPTGAKRCRGEIVYAAVEDGATFADRLAGLVNARWDLSELKQAYWGCDGEKAYQDIGQLVRADAMGVIDRWHLNDKTRKLAPKHLAGPVLKAIDQLAPERALTAISQWMSVAAHECQGRESPAFERSMGKLGELYKYIAGNRKRIIDASLGTMEATNAHVVCSRTKHTGLAWSEQGLDCMVRCRSSLAGDGAGTLRPAPVRPQEQKPAGHTGLEQTAQYQLKPPLSGAQANRMRAGRGSTARQAHVATQGDRKRATRRSTR
jgi:hypothetical protein